MNPTPLKNDGGGSGAMTATGRLGAPNGAESGQVRIFHIGALRPSPDNEKLYRPVRTDDPEIQGLAASIRDYGVKEPLRITRDGCILSGHRRYAACLIAGVTEVPCLVDPIPSRDPGFLVLL